MNTLDIWAVERAAKGTPISPTNCRILLSYLRNLKEHDLDTYEHSIRVGSLLYYVGRKVAILDPKLMFLAGAGHDLGKIDTPNSLLRQKGVSEVDMQIIREHPRSGYNLILPINRTLAEIVLRHHMHQVHSYPAKFPPLTDLSADEGRGIELCALYLGVADKFDSCTTRYNKEVRGILNLEQTRDFLLGKYPNHAETVQRFLNLVN